MPAWDTPQRNQGNYRLDWFRGKKETTICCHGPRWVWKNITSDPVAQTCKSKRRYAAGFFFSGTDDERNTDAYFINTITYQIAVAIPELQPYISRIIAADSTILSRSLDSQTKGLLLEPLRQLRSDHPNFSQNFPSFVIVVDAVDECGKLGDQCRVIAALAEIVSDGSFPLACLFACRFNPHIERGILTTLTGQIQGQVILGKDGNAERADIRAYLRANVDRIRNNHAFGDRIPQEWPLESDLETIVSKSGGQFIYASTVIRYVESLDNDPHERLQHILGISSTKSGEDPFAALDALYRALMSLVKNLAAAIEILGIELVRSSSQFWMPRIMKYRFDFKGHFRSLDGDIVLAPLASVLKYKNGHITFYHLSFAEFLLDSTRSQEHFVRPMHWQRWIVLRFVPALYDRLSHPSNHVPTLSFLSDTIYLIKEAKPGTELHQAINDGMALVTDYPKSLSSGGDSNIWPFVTCVFLVQFQFYISIDVRSHPVDHY